MQYVIALIIVLVFSLLLALPTMLLWNACLVPAVSILSTVTWLQAWGINILCSLLFNFNVSSNNN